MVLTEDAKGVITASGSEAALFDTGLSGTLANYSAKIITDTMVSGDTIIIKVYSDNPQSANSKLLYSFSYTGVQATSIFLFPIQGKQYKVTIQQTASGVGGFKNFDWVRYKQ